MKHLLFWGAALFGLALAGCSQDSVEEPAAPDAAKSNFVLKAEIASDSRTTLDGMKVDWADGDMLYLVTADETWGVEYNSDKPGATIADYTYGANGFTNTNAATLPELVAGTEYTFRAIYAKASQRSYHRGAATTHSLSANQTQDCLNPTAHIADNDALAGTFTATAPFREASVTMSHLYTLMEVDVKNETGHDLTVTELSMELAAADDFLAGVYTVNFTNSPIDVQVADKGTPSSKITLKVENGAMAAGASLPLYFMMAPLKNYSNPVILQVKDSEGYTYTKTVEGKTLSFEAGKYNKTGYTISEADVVETATFVKVTAAPADWTGTYLVAHDNAVCGYSSSYLVQDESIKVVGESITTSKDNSNAISFESTGDGYYYAQLASGQYLGWSSGTKFATAATPTDKYKWKIDYQTDGTVKIALDAAGRFWGWNNTSQFRTYATSNIGTYPMPTLYKLEE